MPDPIILGCAAEPKFQHRVTSIVEMLSRLPSCAAQPGQARSHDYEEIELE